MTKASLVLLVGMLGIVAACWAAAALVSNTGFQDPNLADEWGGVKARGLEPEQAQAGRFFLQLVNQAVQEQDGEAGLQERIDNGILPASDDDWPGTVFTVPSGTSVMVSIYSTQKGIVVVLKRKLP